MGFTKVWIHLVWATKKREPVLHKELRTPLFLYIRENAKKKNIHLDFVNGYTDHVHCLISLDADQTIAKIVQLMKGESSYWINQQKLLQRRFEWQAEYFAVSIGESGINNVREYIKNQEQHHQKKTFEQGYREFIEKYDFVLEQS